MSSTTAGLQRNPVLEGDNKEKSNTSGPDKVVYTCVILAPRGLRSGVVSWKPLA